MPWPVVLPASHHRAPRRLTSAFIGRGNFYRDQGVWPTLKMPGGSLRWARDRPEKSPAFARNFAEKRTHPSSAAQLFLNTQLEEGGSKGFRWLAVAL